MLPAPFRPMLAAPAEEAFDHPEHLFEPKCDGFRCLAFSRPGHVTLFSRTGRVVTDGYPEVVAAVGKVPGEVVFDGELVVCVEDGVPAFQLMQQRNFAHLPAATRLQQFPVRFFVFDVCWRDGDLRERPLSERRAVLEELAAEHDLVTTMTVVGDGCALYEKACEMGFEGMVAKRLDSLYRPGLRSRAWRKVKAARNDRVVVVGFTAGTGGRGGTFGSLVMAQAGPHGWGHVGQVRTR